MLDGRGRVNKKPGLQGEDAYQDYDRRNFIKKKKVVPIRMVTIKKQKQTNKKHPK